VITMSSQTTFDAAMDLVRAHIARHPIAPEALPGFIGQVHESLLKIARVSIPTGGVQTDDAAVPAATAPVPAVPVESSVTRDFILCLEDGSRHKMMKRYLRRRYGMSPADYRRKWGLRSDYPMTAPGYSQAKRLEARAVGLGSAANKRGVNIGLAAVAA